MEKIYSLMKYLQKYEPFNESFKSWVSIFLILSGLGMVPIDVKASSPQEQKEFVESQPQEVVDAARFANFLKERGLSMDISHFADFQKENPDVKTSPQKVEQVLKKSNKNIHNFIPVNWVSDLADIIPDQSEVILNSRIERFKDSSTVEIAVITLETLGDEPISDYAQDQFRRLGIGSKVNNSGVLIVIAKNDRKIRVHTGYGVEGALPDMICRRIGADVMGPFFRKGDYYGGIDSAISTIIERIGDEKKVFKQKELEESSKMSNEDLFNYFLSFTIICGIFMIVAATYTIRKTKREKREMIKNLLKSVNLLIDRINSLNISKRTDSEKLNRLASDLSKLKVELENVNRTKDVSNASFLTQQGEKILKSYITYSEDLKRLENTYESEIRSKSSTFKSLMSDLSNLVNTLNGMGIPTNLKASPISVSIFDELASSITSKDLDKAISIYEKIVNNINVLSVEKQNLSNRISVLERNKKYLEKWESHLKSKMMESEFERYANDSDRSELKSKLAKFKSLLNEPDHSKSRSKFNEILEFLDVPKQRYLRKKREEEEEERRRRYYSSYSSYSSSSSSSSYSSDSDSGFSGFSGGSSGGGGADSSW